MAAVVVAMTAVAEMVATVAETVVAMTAVASLPQYLKGRGDCCSNHHWQVSPATTTISAAATWMPWLKLRWLEGLF